MILFFMSLVFCLQKHCRSKHFHGLLLQKCILWKAIFFGRVLENGVFNPNMKIEILSIGNEVVSGDIVNTNAAWLSEELWGHGFEVIRHTTVADDEKAMAEALNEAASRAQVVVCTGGLGPTVDDFTLEVAGSVFGRPLQKDSGVMAQLEGFYTARGRVMTPNQERQAMIPQGAQVFHNPVGSAPGVRCEHRGVNYFFMPGVPKEMKEIFGRSILPWLLERRDPPLFFRSKTLRCFGAEEAKLDHLIQPLLKDRVTLGESKIAFRVWFPEIFIKVSSWSESEKGAEARLQKAVESVRPLIDSYLYAEDAQTLEETVGKLLLKKTYRLAVAESCTGGLLANRLTNVPGSSEYFLGGTVVYSNSLKEKLLGVSSATMERFGAVSRETAIEMAEGARDRLGADLAVAITGIAGPGGGSEEKPVGTFHIALAGPTGTEERKFFFPLDRERFKLLATSVALNWVRRYLLGEAE